MFEPSLISYLIILPLVFMAGFVDSIAGGGGLISLPAYMIAGLPTHNAIATNKLSSGMGVSVATFRLSKAGQIPWKRVWIYMLCGLAGSAAGANLALLVPDQLFKIIMLPLLPLLALYLLKAKPTEKEREPLPEAKTLRLASLIALLIGVYDGFYGPGTGTFLILLLTGVAHYPLGEANGITKAINLSTNVAALTVYLSNGRTLLLLGLCAGLFNMAGNYVGISFFAKKGSKIVLPLMILVISIFFIRILGELFFP